MILIILLLFEKLITRYVLWIKDYVQNMIVSEYKVNIEYNKYSKFNI